MRLGDGLAMNAAALRRVDVLVLDERSWAGLSAGKRGAVLAAVLAAVRQGLGLVLRATGPVSPVVRRQWAVMAPPGERAVDLLVDPASQGCAGYWPRVAGWHQLRAGEGGCEMATGVADRCAAGGAGGCAARCGADIGCCQ